MREFFSPKSPNRSAFTLIELLIVVAIIAILAAIAVPNFLEAQTRAKVSRAKNDLRCLATGLETYRIDNNEYPYNLIYANHSFFFAPFELTSPISYVTQGCLYDIFRVTNRDGATNPVNAAIPSTDRYNFQRRYVYQNTKQWIEEPGQWEDENGTPWFPRTNEEQGGWYLASFGPDLRYGPEVPVRTPVIHSTIVLYDPTNGTTSQGDIVRTQRDPEGHGIDR